MRILRSFALACLGLACAHAGQVKITLLATTDLHGNIYPYDYYQAKPVPRGLAKIATLIAAARSENPNSLLIDCGDTIQGTPLEYVHQTQVRNGQTERADPMMLSMNLLGYDAMVLGNHEFNYGLKNLVRARETAKFPWISANTIVARDAAVKPFEPFLVKTVSGVRVGIVGITTPLIPQWELAENYRGLRWRAGVEATREAVGELKAKHHPDIVIVAGHTGLDRELATGTVRPEDSEENMIYEIALQVHGIDGIVFGHTHQELPEFRVGDVLLMQPKNWGISLGRMDFELDGEPGAWKITSKHSRVIPVTPTTQVDERVIELARAYHDNAEAYLNTPVANAPVEMNGRMARVEDTPLLEAIQEVQLFYAKADISFASIFNTHLVIPKGPVTVRQIAALYIYDNDLYAIEGTGKMVRDALENAARYFKTGGGLNPRVIGFNYDIAKGVEYEIDLTQPEGHRISNLKWHGAALRDDQKLRLAVNSYRAGGSAGYTMFKGAKIVWRSPREIRDLMVEYYTERKQLPAKAEGNWRIEPPAAREVLRREAARDTPDTNQ
jgi:2',3'-cyclic-nucleotide 2'-phosphodiesterase/3'-nucleotidase